MYRARINLVYLQGNVFCVLTATGKHCEIGVLHQYPMLENAVRGAASLVLPTETVPF